MAGVANAACATQSEVGVVLVASFDGRRAGRTWARRPRMLRFHAGSEVLPGRDATSTWSNFSNASMPLILNAFSGGLLAIADMHSAFEFVDPAIFWAESGWTESRPAMQKIVEGRLSTL